MAALDNIILQCAQSLRASSDNSSDSGTSGSVLKLIRELRDNCDSGKATVAIKLVDLLPSSCSSKTI